MLKRSATFNARIIERRSPSDGAKRSRITAVNANARKSGDVRFMVEASDSSRKGKERVAQCDHRQRERYLRERKEMHRRGQPFRHCAPCNDVFLTIRSAISPTLLIFRSSASANLMC